MLSVNVSRFGLLQDLSTEDVFKKKVLSLLDKTDKESILQAFTLITLMLGIRGLNQKLDFGIGDHIFKTSIYNHWLWNTLQISTLRFLPNLHAICHILFFWIENSQNTQDKNFYAISNPYRASML